MTESVVPFRRRDRSAPRHISLTTTEGPPGALDVTVTGLPPSRPDDRETPIAPRRPRPHARPSEDLALIVASLIEALAEHRHTLKHYPHGPRLVATFEAFRAQLAAAGFRVRWEDRRDRALAHRRLGELAEFRGDVRAAMAHYQLAIAAWSNVGCRKQLQALAAAPVWR